ncbi:MAG: hypothetical protein KBA46_07690 [Candidatus Omnitrophica bacterium]|nr:hypothetical protein [Candidatus Omnitrophota bacterium]
MNYICPICNKELPPDVFSYVKHGEGHIIEEIKKSHPEWSEKDSLCIKCYAYYKKSLRGK